LHASRQGSTPWLSTTMNEPKLEWHCPSCIDVFTAFRQDTLEILIRLHTRRHQLEAENRAFDTATATATAMYQDSTPKLTFEDRMTPEGIEILRDLLVGWRC
jgi:hypothetical protein